MHCNLCICMHLHTFVYVCMLLHTFTCFCIQLFFIIPAFSCICPETLALFFVFTLISLHIIFDECE